MTSDTPQVTQVQESVQQPSANSIQDTTQLQILQLLREIQKDMKENKKQRPQGSQGTQRPNRNRKTRDNPTWTRSVTDKYCWTHGGCNHEGKDCTTKALGHKDEATKENKLGGSKAFCS